MYNPITIIHELNFPLLSTCQALEACHGALEAGVVVEGDLGHDVVRPVVLVEVIGGRRSSNQGPVQLVWVVLAGVTEGSPGALSRRGVTSCCLSRGLYNGDGLQTKENQALYGLYTEGV